MGRPPLPASLGAAGAVLLTAGAWAVVLAPGSVAALAAAVAGTGLVVLAWLLLLRLPVTTAQAVRTLVVWTAPLLVAPPLFSRDVHSYLAQGAVALRGIDPHRVGPAGGLPPGSPVLARVDGYWRDTPSPYGPVTDLLQKGVAAVAGDGLVAGVALYRLLAVAAVAGIAWALARLAAAHGVPPGRALVAGALNPLVLWHVVGGMHNDGPMLALLLAGLAVGLGPSLAAGAALVALGALVKAPAAAGLAVLAIAAGRRGDGPGARWRGVAVVAGTGAAVLVAGSALVAPGWVAALSTPGQLTSWMAPTNWAGLAAAALGADPAAAPATARAAGTVLAVLLAAGVLVAQARGRVRPLAATGLVLGAVVVLGPVLHPWYLLWALTPVAAVPLVPRARTALTAVSAVFALLLPPMAGDFSGRGGALVLAYAAALLAVAAVAVAAVRTRAVPPGRRGSC
ncbi:polyprenol phosphomannose-dependent alpha 1,6 mannosyltransferase MptB [Pseudonocardia spirodelae]|uniref:Polyprenol phosphomannose-dependent alpha 1,6 mannosyltransferase MptB n=1 Tax=Pseudonocardia spirodelae TaxID=3133431 RepID=A0ABU8T4V1_9PSEU